ncbi:trigger factor [Geomonas sp.]|uniref:trigger factor n=1 Tax=Geomonas sp. TaxID=2651584 RepID=UPI002B4820F3|nr:trigger factor [Geomonas sp.]HJV36376.1 trigger factor [Geomonas sp.]
MQTNVEKLSSIKQKISFEIPAERVAAEVDKAYASIRKQAAIKGFRKGKVPQSVIEKQYGAQMAEDVVKNLVNDSYFKALAEHNLNPVSYPMIDADTLIVGQPFKFSATFDVFPDVELKEYLDLPVQKEKLELDENAAVESRLAQLRENLAQLSPAAEGRAAQKGDFVTFDFKGSIEGVPFEGGEAQDFQLELGSRRFIPGFEEQMEGLTVGAETTITVNFPEDYHNAELAGKPADFAITVKDIKVKELPELNDDFAKEFGEFETLDELKEKLAEVARSQEEQRINSDLRERLMSELVERNDLEVPEVLVDRQLQMLLENSKQKLAAQRLTLEMMGTTEEGYKTQFREVAANQVKCSLILDAVADKEGIQIAEEEVVERVQGIAASAGQDPEKLLGMYQGNQQAKESLIAQMREEKTLTFVLEKAKVSEVPKDQIKDED